MLSLGRHLIRTSVKKKTWKLPHTLPGTIFSNSSCGLWETAQPHNTTLFGFGFLYDLDLDGTEIDDILQHTKNRNRTRYVLTKRGKNTEGPFLFYSLFMHQSLSLSLFLSLTTLSLLWTKYLSSTATPPPPPVAAAAAVAAWHTNIDRKKEREGRKKWIWICAGATRCERRCRFPQTTSSKNIVGKVKSMSCKKTTIFGHKNQEGRSRAVRSSNAMQQRATT